RHHSAGQFCILPDLDKVKAVADFKIPRAVRHVRQFLGLTSYCCHFIKDCTSYGKCEAAINFLKGCLTSAPVLMLPDLGCPFFIHADASDAGLGAALIQKDEDSWDVAVAYASCALRKAEKPYSTPEKECIVHAICHGTLPPPPSHVVRSAECRGFHLVCNHVLCKCTHLYGVCVFCLFKSLIVCVLSWSLLVCC
uniref:Reverse transcriptase/retrotransposon-derived protein RNase H-like domain-containing protein n=1 Tax=Electrophorus electricus TaxID=8005 RepID=A0A4W4HFS0_ELEEL